MNKIIIIGNVTREPERKFTASGLPYTRISVAVNRKSREQGADFFNVVAWNKLAETCAAFVSKGSKICVEGSVQIREYEGKDGVKRSTIDIIASSVEFLNRVERLQEDPVQPVLERVDVPSEDLPF